MFRLFLWSILMLCFVIPPSVGASSRRRKKAPSIQKIKERAEPPFVVEVLSQNAGSQKSPRNILLRIKIPDQKVMPLPVTQKTVSVYVLPKGVSFEGAKKETYKCSGLFIKELRGEYYLDVRVVPSDLGRSAHLGVVIRQGKSIYQQFYPGAIEFADERASVVLVVDSSHSMLQTDPQRLRVKAAKSFVDQAARGGSIAEIGVVRFSAKAEVLSELVPTSKVKDLHSALDNLGAAGRTDIDGALDRAYDLFEKARFKRKVVILLTDGKNEVGPFKSSHRKFKDAGIVVYTIGLSDQADQEVLEQISKETNGNYFEAPTQQDLHDIYQRIGTTIQKRAVIHTSVGKIESGTRIRQPVVIDSSLTDLEIAAHSSEGLFDFALVSPSNKEIRESSSNTTLTRGDGYGVFQILDPQQGKWQVVLSEQVYGGNLRNKPRTKKTNSMKYNLRIEGDSPLFIEPFVYPEYYFRGEPVDISCSLSQREKIPTNTSVFAEITLPDGNNEQVELMDDGKHGDTLARDGVWSTIFPKTSLTGVYRVILYSEGTSPSGEDFTRVGEYSFSVNNTAYDGLKSTVKVLDMGAVVLGETAKKSITLSVRSGNTLKVSMSLVGFPKKAFTYTIPKTNTIVGSKDFVLEITPTKEADLPYYKGELILNSPSHRMIIPVQLSIIKPQVLFLHDPITLGKIGRGTSLKHTTSLSIVPIPKKDISVAVTYFPLVNAENNEIKGARIEGPAVLTFKKGQASLAFSVAVPKELPDQWMFSWIAIDHPAYTGRVKLRLQRFDGLLKSDPPELSFGTIKHLPFTGTAKITLSGSFYGIEELRYSIVPPHALYRIGP